MFEFDIIPLHLIPWLLLISVLSWASLLALNSGYNEWVNKLSIVGLFAMFPFVLSFALICKQVLCCKHCLQFKSNYGIGSIEMHFVCCNFQYVSFEKLSWNLLSYALNKLYFATTWIIVYFSRQIFFLVQ